MVQIWQNYWCKIEKKVLSAKTGWWLLVYILENRGKVLNKNMGVNGVDIIETIGAT